MHQTDAVDENAVLDREPDIATKRAYYPAVQGLRGLAAFSVLLLHLYAMALHGDFLPVLPTLLDTAWSTLGQGVPLFFIISGFVIPGSLLRHKNLQRFYVDRLLRIMPLFVVLHFVVFTVGPFVGYKWLRGIGLVHYLELFVTNLTFTALPLGLPLAQQNSWTLTFEWGFYFLIGASWLAFNHSGSRFVTLPILVALAAISCYEQPICLYFGLGILFARFPRTIRFAKPVEVVAVPAAFVAYYYLAQDVNVVYATIPAIVIFLAVLQENSVTAKILTTRPLQYLGLISYSLYLVHPVAVFPYQALGHYLVHHGVSPSRIFVPYTVLGFVTALVASVACYHLIEVGLRTYLTSLTKVARAANAERLAADRNAG